MYQITQYTKDRAKELGVTVKNSTKPHKKIDVFKSGSYVCSIGDDRYKDYPTYILERSLEYANERRRLYLNRHKSDIIYGTPGWYVARLLW